MTLRPTNCRCPAAIFVFVLLAAGCSRPNGSPPGLAHPHVQLVHLDGYRPDVVRSMLSAGQLPNIETLLKQGRVSYRTATVDKSETMKVIQSYLSSRLDTTVVGWWQFSRKELSFRNFWLEPADVLGYALGTEFPRHATLQDFLAYRGENLVAAMSLARRSVPFENYGRAYVEGVRAVSEHSYLRQAHATASRHLQIQRRIAESEERSPALSILLLAAADEFAHLEGVTTGDPRSEVCFSREGGELEDDTLFRLLEEDADHDFGGALASLESRYFTRVGRRPVTGGVREICLSLPTIGDRRVHPHYALAMVTIDIELGYLIECLRSIRFSADGSRRIERPPPIASVSGGVIGPEDSLFARTLFILFGDHGMTDTSRGMRVETDPPFDDAPEGLEPSLLTFLRSRLVLDGEKELAIDYLTMPSDIRHPSTDLSWQDDRVRSWTKEAETWSEEFLDELHATVKSGLYEDYWWLFFLRSLFIDPKLDEALAPVSDPARAMFRELYLRAVPDYRASESRFRRTSFDGRVRLVYGGGARNNAELFLPVCSEEETCSWERRPTYQEISSYRHGESGSGFLDLLRENDGVGLIFVRRNNEVFAHDRPPPAETEIEVRDREDNRATISVRRDEESGELVFGYATGENSLRDPLGYDDWGAGEGSFGTYNEWNDRTVAAGSHYLNAVAGMGAYLFSNNPAIGDVVLLHREGWNFGDNLAGHGGIEREEKQTLLLVSGPGVSTGELMGQGRYRTDTEGAVRIYHGEHYPTLLDIAPTALQWLGYGRAELDTFSREEFPRYLERWRNGQRETILAAIEKEGALNDLASDSGMVELDLTRLHERLDRLLRFIEVGEPSHLDEPGGKSLGNVLILGSEPR